MKKVLIIISYVILIGAGVFGSLFFYKKNKDQIEINEQLIVQNSQIQASLDAIGLMTTVYEVQTPQQSGREIKMEDLKAVSVPVSSLGETSITDPSVLVGAYYKVNTKPGTVLTMDLLMDENGERCIYTRDIVLSYAPVSTVPGDYVDIRVLLPSGEDFVALSHKKVRYLGDPGYLLTLELTEAELQIYNTVITDQATFQGYGLSVYATKYVEPGLDVSTVAYYPVTHDAENILKLNENIGDYTRCINPTLRDHIDEVLWFAALQSNQELATSIATFHTQTAGTITNAQSLWIQDHTTDDGRVLSDEEWAIYIQNGGGSNNNSYSYDNSNNGYDNFTNEVNNSLDQTADNVDAFVEEGTNNAN